MSNQDRKAIFITGSSSGLGRAAAKLFASKGWNVIASMRDPKKEHELGKIPGLQLVTLDVTDPREIERAAEQVVSSGGVDVVFNNAGSGLTGALEGWSESMAFELNPVGIGIKTVEPGGIRTDFFTRSLDTGHHPAYDALVNKFMGMITDPKQMATYSTPEQIAEVVYEAATDGKDQLRYVAGADAKEIYALRMQLGDEAFRKAMARQFLGDIANAA